MSRLLLLLILLLLAPLAHAGPQNAPDVRGKFVLVVSATVHQPMGHSYAHGESYTNLMQQPLVVIPGFDSFYRCRGAGMELQARMRSDGYTIDFSCLLQGKPGE